ncbi:MAG: hypothetical protein F6K24_24885 [Okeania sp. SIO2D1]|nr:hypothetical protein [Okeania sp. SIO2D1]
MYMAKSKDSGESDRYIIGISGTNLVSLHGWTVQNLSVSTTRLWNKGQPWHSDPEDQTTPGIRVAAGFCEGIRILFEEMQYNEQSLLEYLNHLTSSASKPLSITICGHSLGAALSPTLALSLIDRRAEWDPNEKATVWASFSSGASPGNKAFAQDYDMKLDQKTDRIWSELDYVANTWEKDMIEGTRTFYEPYIKPTALINAWVDWLLDQSISSGVEYKHVWSQQEGFNLGYNPDALSSFIQFIFDFFGLSPEEQIASSLSGVVAKTILHNLGIENQSRNLIDSLSESLKPLIKELSEKSQLGKIALPTGEINKTVEPYVEQIIEKLQTEKSISNIKGSKNHLRLLLSTLLDFIKYISQGFYHHWDSCVEYLEVSEFIDRTYEIIKSTS